MSPEQVEGKRAIDERTDVFSVGVVLYEMLAIREPFRGSTVDETFDNIVRAEPTPPSERSPERYVPLELERILTRALRKKPSERYQSMRELIGELQAARASIEEVDR